jgi:hypothetical protein
MFPIRDVLTTGVVSVAIFAGIIALAAKTGLLGLRRTFRYAPAAVRQAFHEGEPR